MINYTNMIVNPVYRSHNGSIKAFQVLFNRTTILNKNIVFVDEFNKFAQLLSQQQQKQFS